MEILDNFDRFFDNVDKDTSQLAREIRESSFYEGIEMMRKSTNSVFSRFNISKMEVKMGEKADFDKHEVVFVTPMPDKEDDSIIFIQE